MKKILDEMYDILFILLVTGIFTFIANVMQTPTVDLADSSIGVLILIIITAVGMLIAKLPGFKMLPMVFWVSILAVILSIPELPGTDTILYYTGKVGFLPLTTPVLAYCGLSLGKDIEGFKRLSWRIVPVALAVAAGSFICATALAEVMLHLEGIF
ncbi:hypothetical protein [Sutterella sp.]|uniref:hypothetical protein n=1 Tax=Sutterella sp. TaxID=1981025 RepID=UPI0026DFA434|nr:hypothetical protein [Sutterella sp.]MDO5531720.1 hypothetical protein [Sutterella sp.]